MLHNLTGWHALIILAIIVLVFGAAKLPALAKSLGQSVRILKDETTETRTSSESESVFCETVTDPVTTGNSTVDESSVEAQARSRS